MKSKFTFFPGYICAAFISSSISVNAQNLVPNYSFDVMDTCPLVSEITLAHPWNSPTVGTPDLYNSTCSTQNLQAHTGVGSSGVFVFNTFPDNREYIQSHLISPLVSGQNYCVSFWVKRLNYRYATNRIGAYFSTDSIYVFSTSNLPYIPQVDNPPGNELTSNNWVQISGSFTASGGESFIIIGSFATDAETDTIVANSSSTSLVAYYAIDDISVTNCITGIEEESAGIQDIRVFPSPATEFINVELPFTENIKSLRLVNAAGQQVRYFTGVNNERNYVLNIQSVVPGIYFLFIETEDDVINKMVIVSR